MQPRSQKHIDPWIDAYSDGSLSDEQLQQVEAHLSGCPACQEKLEERRRLSALLKAWPRPEGLLPAERFSSQVLLRLPRTTPQPAGAGFLHITWKAIPVGVIGLWAFGQAVALVTFIVLALVATGPGLSLNPWGRILLSEATWNMNWLDFGEVIFSSVSISLGMTLVTATLLFGWLASWLAYQKHQQS